MVVSSVGWELNKAEIGVNSFSPLDQPGRLFISGEVQAMGMMCIGSLVDLATAHGAWSEFHSKLLRGCRGTCNVCCHQEIGT